MLEEVRIQNFKSLKDCRVKLGDFQVLVGVNGSGKSSFLQALDVLGKVVAYQERFDAYFESSFKLMTMNTYRNREKKRCFTQSVNGISLQGNFFSSDQ